MIELDAAGPSSHLIMEIYFHECPLASEIIITLLFICSYVACALRASLERDVSKP
jgi:hypothetical protein